jgi:hypothetical protein
VFCAEDISSAQIIRAMLDLTQLDIDYKIAPPKSLSIIGSNSIHTAGDLYVVNVNAISKWSNRRRKRIFDFLFSLGLLIFSPVIIWFFKNKANLFSNIFGVLTAKKSWVGYILKEGTFETLPKIKPGVLNPGDMFAEISIDTKKETQLNILYARNYSLLTDTEIIFKGWRRLDG